MLIPSEFSLRGLCNNRIKIYRKTSFPSRKFLPQNVIFFRLVALCGTVDGPSLNFSTIGLALIDWKTGPESLGSSEFLLEGGGRRRLSELAVRAESYSTTGPPGQARATVRGTQQMASAVSSLPAFIGAQLYWSNR